MRIISEAEALRIAREYGLEKEIARCIHEEFMEPSDALYEYDLLNDNELSNEDFSGANQYIETEYTCYD